MSPKKRSVDEIFVQPWSSDLSLFSGERRNRKMWKMSHRFEERAGREKQGVEKRDCFHRNRERETSHSLVSI